MLRGRLVHTKVVCCLVKAKVCFCWFIRRPGPPGNNRHFNTPGLRTYLSRGSRPKQNILLQRREATGDLTVSYCKTTERGEKGQVGNQVSWDPRFLPIMKAPSSLVPRCWLGAAALVGPSGPAGAPGGQGSRRPDLSAACSAQGTAGSCAPPP